MWSSRASPSSDGPTEARSGTAPIQKGLYRYSCFRARNLIPVEDHRDATDARRLAARAPSAGERRGDVLEQQDQMQRVGGGRLEAVTQVEALGVLVLGVHQ